MTASFDAVVLAGGAARRLGGASKADVVVAGRTLLDRVLDATSGARRVVVVGPPALARPGVATTLEDPAGGGPVAGIDAGLRFLDAAADDVPGAHVPDLPVLVLACDVPGAVGAVPALLAVLADHPEADGAHVVDASGRAQLVALHRRRPLHDRLDVLRAEDGVHGLPVRRLLEGLTMAAVADDDAADDADTWDDVARLDLALDRADPAREAGPSTGGDPMTEHPTPSPSDLHRWVVATAEHLGVDPDAVDVDLILDLARDVAHEVARPAVPLTTFLMGYAVATTGGDRAALERVAAQVAGQVQQWPTERSPEA